MTAAFGQGATPLTTVRVGLGFTQPVFLTSPPNDTSRLFIVEQGGAIKIIKNGTTLTRPFINISDRISTGFERGLLGMAFHPNYAANRYFYVNYTDVNGDVRLSRFQASTGDPDSAVLTSESILLTVQEPEPNHNGGTVAFSPVDGYLYLSLGDGGSGGDPHGTIGNGQDLTTLLGKILRLDVDGGTPYAIPSDNPFVGIPGRDEIWSYGWRNPWRLSFDRLNGDMYIGDVGQGLYEEIDFESITSGGGQNYGWRLMEGFHCYNPSTNCDPGGLTYPVTEYTHSLGCSVTGGYVYRGCRIPDLRGTYFYADYCSGRIWSFRYNGSTMTDSTERTAELGGGTSIGSPSSFGEDSRGELYITDHDDGEVYKIVPAGPVQSDCGDPGCCLVPGDANGDGSANVGDGVFLINRVFKNGAAPGCSAEADVNNDCSVNVGDAVFMINRVFKNGAAPTCSLCFRQSVAASSSGEILLTFSAAKSHISQSGRSTRPPLTVDKGLWLCQLAMNF